MTLFPSDDYFVTVPPDPTDGQMEAIREALRGVCVDAEAS